MNCQRELTEQANKMDVLLTMLNAMLEALKPVKFSDINILLHSQDGNRILTVEKKFPVLGVRTVGTGYGCSVASILATVTAVLCGERLCFVIDDFGNVVKFDWFSNIEETNADEAAYR
jgi:hypothetical protein